jgi:hypothetical protein
MIYVRETPLGLKNELIYSLLLVFKEGLTCSQVLPPLAPVLLPFPLPLKGKGLGDGFQMGLGGEFSEAVIRTATTAGAQRTPGAPAFCSPPGFPAAL